MTIMESDSYYDDGKNDYLDGVLLEDNPYVGYDDIAAEEWEEGWLDADAGAGAEWYYK